MFLSRERRQVYLRLDNLGGQWWAYIHDKLTTSQWKSKDLGDSNPTLPV